MFTIINTKVVDRGTAAVWIEGRKLAVGFQPHENYNLLPVPGKRQIRLVKAEAGEFRVSVRTLRGEKFPLLELKQELIARTFQIGMKIRVVIRAGMVVLEEHRSQSAQADRERRFIDKVRAGTPLRVGSYFTGGGILDRAIHEGLSNAGIQSYLALAVERESSYIECLLRNQSELFRDDSVVMHSSVEDVDLKKVSNLDVFLAGIPCTGSSRAGKSKNKITKAEEHSDAGAAFFYTLNMIKEANPALITLENVTGYENEASFFVIAAVLETWGYQITTKHINGHEFGSLEDRTRLAVIATSAGLPVFDIDSLIVPLRFRENSLSEVMETLPLDDKRWKSYSYLKEKEVRDRAAGKGFGRSMYSGEETCVTTIRRLYHKGGSCDQFVQHPTDTELSRLFTDTEHAAIKTVPSKLVEGVSATIAHEILGQGVVFWAFVSVGQGIGVYALLAAGLIEGWKYSELSPSVPGELLVELQLQWNQHDLAAAA